MFKIILKYILKYLRLIVWSGCLCVRVGLRPTVRHFWNVTYNEISISNTRLSKHLLGAPETPCSVVLFI